ncbi:unnamed protein product [Mytilus coruscus]|uniref:NADAR domain-containing protein n=1 Tax=Mytilus coruscus TaxID=42192 RepID=A0A6J8EI56_MYTCO|nr:unnamed protein product [Mytilus coruscus]
MGTKRQRDSNEDDINKESQRAESKRQEKMDHYLTKKDSTQINREKSQVNSGEETEVTKEKNSKYDIPIPDVKKSDKSEKEKSEDEIKSKHKQALDTESTEMPSKRMKIDEDSTVKDKNLITNYVEYVSKDKHRTNEESRNTSSDNFSVSHKEPSKKPKKNKKDKKSKHSHKHSHKHRSESDKKSKHSGSHKERKSHRDSNEHENEPNQQRLDKEKKFKHSHADSSESEENSPYSHRDSEKKAQDSHTDRIPKTDATYPQRDSEIHSERSHRSFYSSDSETSPSKERCSHRDIPEKTSNRSDKKTEKGCGFKSRERKESGGTPKHSSNCSKNDEYVPSSKRHEDSSKHSHSSYSGTEGSSKGKSKEDKVIVQSRKRHSGHIETSPSIDKSYPSEKMARHSLKCESTPETPELHLEKGKSKSPKKSERKSEETTDSSNTDLKEKHRNNINILIESMKEEKRFKNSAERIRHLVHTDKLITTRDDFVFFFGMVSPFSQFHAANFKVQNIMYRCAEQYMMHQKAVLFGDKEIAKKIMEETKPLKMKRLGRKVRNFDAVKWGDECIEVVKSGNIAKFSQNYLLEQSLFATHPKIMAEASPRDCLWGIGLGASNAKAWNVRSWRGKNLLGYTLMDVREILMRAKGLIK